jgi:hypothetical protein
MLRRREQLRGLYGLLDAGNLRESNEKRIAFDSFRRVSGGFFCEIALFGDLSY